MSVSTKEQVTMVAELADRAATPLLEVADLSVTYSTPSGPFKAVDGFSLSVARGERIAIVGESGSGKTNSAMAIAGFLAADAQVDATRLRFGATDLLGRRAGVLPSRIPGISVVFQDAMSSLDPVWKVGSQLRSVIRHNEKVGRKAADALAEQWLHRVGLHDTARVLGARPYELSGGMRQRVMIALGLCAQPELLIADEPTSALDATLSRELMQLMVSLTEEFGTALIIVSHDISLCQEFTDRTVVMHKGKIVEEGRSADLARTATAAYTKGLLACIPTLESSLLEHLPTMNSAGEVVR